ncbi:MAG: hypothetical protein J6Q15_03180 [Clostridia bacterium]|nr:hypothetical protein [Clostridia bacterium]
MIEYDIAYKHLGLDVGDKKIIVELSLDNMMGEKTFSATSNLLFFDSDETWGHACGVGETEHDALNMCINEIENYTNSNVDTNMVYETDLPKRLTFVYKKETVILYFKKVDNEYILLTSQGIIKIPNELDLIKYIDKNAKKLSKLGIKQYSKEYFQNHKFEELFENMTEKYHGI